MKKTKRRLLMMTSVLLLAACSKPVKKNVDTLPAENTSSTQTVNKVILTMSCQNSLLSKANMQQLNQQANFLLAKPKVTVMMQSFTPAVGSEDLNLAQAQLRAQAAANYLGLKGVGLSRIQIQSYGGAYDTSPAANAACQVVILDQS